MAVMKKLKIYISGPITGLPYEEVKRRFERDKRDLAAADFEPVSPIDNGLPPDTPWEEHMKRDLAILATCDGIYLQSGWEKSKGCRIEVNAALTLPHVRIIIKETIKTPKTNKTRCETKVT